MQEVVNAAIRRNIVFFAVAEVDRNAVEKSAEILDVVGFDVGIALCRGVAETVGTYCFVVFLRAVNGLVPAFKVVLCGEVDDCIAGVADANVIFVRLDFAVGVVFTARYSHRDLNEKYVSEGVQARSRH